MSVVSSSHTSPSGFQFSVVDAYAGSAFCSLSISLTPGGTLTAAADGTAGGEHWSRVESLRSVAASALIQGF